MLRRWLKIKKKRINDRIKAKKIRLISEEGEQIGVVDLQRGLDESREKGVDLVEVAPQADPPVCRIMDYNKYKYKQEKKRQKAKKSQSTTELKQIRVRPNIEEHDYKVKLKHLRRFLNNGNRARISLMFKGRERAHPEMGRKILDKFLEDLSDIGEVEDPPTLKGRFMVTLLEPKKK